MDERGVNDTTAEKERERQTETDQIWEAGRQCCFRATCFSYSSHSDIKWSWLSFKDFSTEQNSSDGVYTGSMSFDEWIVWLTHSKLSFRSHKVHMKSKLTLQKSQYIKLEVSNEVSLVVKTTLYLFGTHAHIPCIYMHIYILYHSLHGHHHGRDSNKCPNNKTTITFRSGSIRYRMHTIQSISKG